MLGAHRFDFFPPLGIHVDTSCAPTPTSSSLFPHQFSPNRQIILQLISFVLKLTFFQHDTGILEKPINHLLISHIIQVCVWSISFSFLFSKQLANKGGIVIIPINIISLYMIYDTTI
jgi:uncharacterized membrane protein